MSIATSTSQPLSNNNNHHKIRHEPFPPDFLDSRKKSKDGEIAIFGAEKYFNGGINEEKKQKFPKKPPQIEKQKPQVKKPPSTVPSESSWGSQKALIQTYPHQKKPQKTPVKSLLATIGCNCYCDDEKSVAINEHPPEKIVEEPAPIKEDEDDKMRSSLEVFGSPITHKKKKSLSLEKKLAMLKWDANDAVQVEISDGMYEDDGGVSDASSDLFEIASFTTNNNNPGSILLRQASDGVGSGCVTPTTCYAPSEASVEWSVVTASAAEFSVFSDSEETMSLPTLSKSQKKVLNGSKDTERRRLGILSGCKSQKAVRVAGDAYRTVAGDAYRTNGDAVHDPRRQHMARKV